MRIMTLYDNHAFMRIMRGCHAIAREDHIHQISQILHIKAHTKFLSAQYALKCFDPTHPILPATIRMGSKLNQIYHANIDETIPDTCPPQYRLTRNPDSCRQFWPAQLLGIKQPNNRITEHLTTAILLLLTINRRIAYYIYTEGILRYGGIFFHPFQNVREETTNWTSWFYIYMQITNIRVDETFDAFYSVYLKNSNNWFAQSLKKPQSWVYQRLK